MANAYREGWNIRAAELVVHHRKYSCCKTIMLDCDAIHKADSGISPVGIA